MVLQTFGIAPVVTPDLGMQITVKRRKNLLLNGFCKHLLVGTIEKIIEIEIERLRSFKDHPFQVKDDKEMYLLKERVEKYEILNPLIVRPVPDGVYEIISGHRRKHAAELLGYIEPDDIGTTLVTIMINLNYSWHSCENG